MVLAASWLVACNPLPVPSAPIETSAPRSRVVGYYSSWSIYERDRPVADIPADKLTHLNYAFANVVSGGCALGDPWADVQKPFPGDPANAPFKGNFRQLQLLKTAHPHLRTLISVGGSTFSGGFSDAALTAASRQRFARSCADFVQRYGFDGIDIDWEYPMGGGNAPGRPEDRVNATLLLRALRSELDARAAASGRRYLLSAATPAAAWSLDHYQIAEVAKVVDHLNVMAYDFHGHWDQRTGFNAALRPAPGDPTPAFTGAAAVDLYLSRGVPARLLTFGIPFYGRGWSGVGPTNGGLFQPAKGTVMGTSEPGMWDYSDLVSTRIPVMTRSWSSAAQVPFLYDARTGVFITYDDPTSVRAKAAYAASRGLGGVAIWELGADDDRHSLLAAATATR
ncbi:glycoside hydrolase family 18 protein [Iamia sp. SCSIO 61187]|uniref:glycoside hydrolase family 18 protein n=1 Tax=Iamia sp. SCSIO 61187 TaxID=2722752 RepID=UPI001C62EC48|nr:glycoside hydrolase family 18 protein [Iamia sp. SCSIO 61187]QYG91550.1 glycoside hydrolase family 18 protein [Iamia sp. SCSIO 61187]